MSKRLEDFMKDSREEFDELEPSADLWSRIEKHLPPEGATLKKMEKKTFSLGFVMRVAATVILVMGIGFAVYLKNEKKDSKIDFAAINPAYAQQKAQYTSLIEAKRIELKSLSGTDPELYREFNGEIAKMDSTYKQLNTELKSSPNQERVLRAMIRNLQIQTQVLNQQLQVIEQLNKAKKEQQDNEIKSI